MSNVDQSIINYASMRCHLYSDPIAKSVQRKYNFSTKTYVVGTQKNRLNDGSFEHPKHILKLMGKKMFTFLC